ncbi:MAG: glutathione transferase GstA [Sulfuricella sp.]
MKLYYSPGACSLSPHIVLYEGGFSYELEKVDLSTKKTETGADYFAVNPNGYVPALLLDDGQILTEGPAIVQYLADKVPQKRLVPPAGTMERYRLLEWLNFTTSELHKSFGMLFRPQVSASEEVKTLLKELLERRIAVASRRLGDKPYLMGDEFTVADAYFFTVLRWHKYVGIDISPWPKLAAYLERVAARPAVQAALKAEGLAH